MASLPRTLLLAEEYLAYERNAPARHEYIAGQIVAMTGASRKHNLITVNLSREISLQLKGRTCESYAGEMRVLMPSSGDYVYPDCVIVCGEPVFEDSYLDTLTNPTIVIEVLSPSTELYDRGRKFHDYRSIASLAEYLLIAQQRPHIEHYAKAPDGRWIYTDYDSLEDVVKLASVNCLLRLSEVYDKVVFTE